MTAESVEGYAFCVMCLVRVPVEEYFANDHTCDSCASLHNALLDGQLPRLKD
jgi:hypothetical protein